MVLQLQPIIPVRFDAKRMVFNGFEPFTERETDSGDTTRDLLRGSAGEDASAGGGDDTAATQFLENPVNGCRVLVRMAKMPSALRQQLAVLVNASRSQLVVLEVGLELRRWKSGKIAHKNNTDEK